MKIFITFLLLISFVSAETMFALNSECKRCHGDIYNEYLQSQHAQSSTDADAIHNAVWQKHPNNLQKQTYSCSQCHTPTALNNQLPQTNSTAQNEGVACAYCHRIKEVVKADPTYSNVVTDDPYIYLGKKSTKDATSFHEVVENSHFTQGQSCLGCHTQNKNSSGFSICTLQTTSMEENESCISCHMPQVDGAPSMYSHAKKHTFHGFAGLHNHPEMMARYIDLTFEKKNDGFRLTLTNHAPHALTLHPIRVMMLKVTIQSQDSNISLSTEPMVRILGANNQPTPPWLATTILKDTTFQGKEVRYFDFVDHPLSQGDTIQAVLGYTLVNPKIVPKFGLDKVPDATRFTILESYNFK